MNTDILFAGLSAFSALTSAICAGFAVKITLLNQKESNRPIIQVKSIVTELSASSNFIEPNNQKKHYRIINGEQNHDVSLGNKVPVKNDFTKEEVNFFNSHKGTVSLRIFRGDKSLIINSLTPNNPIDTIVAEVFTNTITFINHGAPIQSAFVNEANIWLRNDKVPKHLDGFGKPLHLPIGKNELFVIHILEVTENFTNTICRMSDSVYERLFPNFDLLHLETGLYLSYDKLTFSITFYTANTNIAYTYLFTLNNIDNRIYITITEEKNK